METIQKFSINTLVKSGNAIVRIIAFSEDHGKYVCKIDGQSLHVFYSELQLENAAPINE